MSAADIIILIVVILLIGAVIFFLIYQNKRSCAGCAYAKNCDTFCSKINQTSTEDEN